MMRGTLRKLRVLLSAGGICFAVVPACATDGTWLTSPTTGDWDTGSNWSSSPAVPDATATFFVSDQTNVTFSANTSIQTIRFTDIPNQSVGFTNFQFDLSLRTLNITGTGIELSAVPNDSAGLPIFNVSGRGSLQLFGDATAGNFRGADFSQGALAIVKDTGEVIFHDESTAGFASIFNADVSGNGGTYFLDHSTAANAIILNDNSNAGFTVTGTTFDNLASAGSATIANTNNGLTTFKGQSTASQATITNMSGAMTFFSDNATAGSAKITQDTGGSLTFFVNSSAGNAIIQNNGTGLGGSTNFLGNSTADNALITNDGGTTNFAEQSTLGNATVINQNGGTTNCLDNSVCDANFIVNNAVIINNAGGSTFFKDNSTAGFARLVANAGGVVDISGLTSSGMTAGSIEGAGTFFLGAKVLTTGLNNLSTEVSGAVADGGASGGVGGSLIKVGDGVLTLSGANTYTGATDVDGGTLVVNGSLLSTVNVNSGGTFKGSGTIRGLNVGSGGIVAPGNSIGTLTIAGDASFATGSVYQAEVNASGQSDRISLSGKTTISGGTVQAVAASGAYGLKTTYTILNSFGGVSGTFSNATTNLAFLTATLSYNASDVFLTLSRNRAFLPGLAKTPNQTNVANALNAVPTDNAAFVAAFGAGTPQAFDALSGEVHADIQTTLIDDSRYVREAVLGRLRQASYAGAGGPLAVLGAGGPTIAYADESDDPRASTVLAYASGNPAFPVKAVPIKAVAPAPARYTYWAQAFGAWGKFGGDGNAADTARSLGGVISGFDARFANNWQAGFALGYTQSDVNVAARSSSGLIDSAHAAVYAGTSVGAWNLRSGAALAWNVVDTSRTAAFPGFTDLDTAKYNSGTGQLFAEIGYGTTVGSIAVEPFADIAYVYLGTQGFEEAGGAAALSAASAAMGVTYSSLGMRLATEYTLMNGWMLTPRLTAAWQHAFGSISPTDALTFANTTANFTVAGVPLARDGALIEVGGELRLTPHIRLGATYSGQLADGVHDHAIKGNFTWTF